MTIPSSTREGLQMYVQHRIPPGGFLQAVLENNLVEAVGRADEYNRAALYDICVYLYHDTPCNCWGSKEKVKKWLTQAEDVE